MNKFKPCLESLDLRITPTDLPGVDPVTGTPIVTPDATIGVINFNFPPGASGTALDYSFDYTGAQGWAIVELWDVTPGQPEVQVDGDVLAASGSGTAWGSFAGLESGHTYRIAVILQGTDGARAVDAIAPGNRRQPPIAPPPLPIELPPPYVP